MGRTSKNIPVKIKASSKKMGKEKLKTKVKLKRNQKENVQQTKATPPPSPAPAICSEEIDRSQVNFPYDVRVSSLKALMKTVEKSTTKVKDTIFNDCDLIMECRACRNLFRSLPNFLCHKEKFCTKRFSHEAGYSQFVQNIDSSYNIQYFVDPNPPSPSSSSTSCSSVENKIVNGHLLPSKKKSDEEKNPVSEPFKERNNNTHFAHQTRFFCDLSTCDVTNYSLPSKNSVVDTAVLDHDGRIMCMGSAPAIENVVAKLARKLENQQSVLEAKRNEACIKCSTCNTIFESDKSLRQHRRESFCPGYDALGKELNTNTELLTSSPAASSKSNENSKTSSNVINKSPDSNSSESNIDLYKEIFAKGKNKRPKVVVLESDEKQIEKSVPKPSLDMVLDSCISKPQTSLSNSVISGSSSSPEIQRKKRGRPPKKAVTLNTDDDIIVLDSSISVSKNQYTCAKCSSAFPTTTEISTHLVSCNGAIDLSLIRQERKVYSRSAIQARNSYPKGSHHSRSSPGQLNRFSVFQGYDSDARESSVSSETTSRGTPLVLDISSSPEQVMGYADSESRDSFGPDENQIPGREGVEYSSVMPYQRKDNSIKGVIPPISNMTDADMECSHVR